MQFYRIGDFYHYHSDKISEHLPPGRISIKDMGGGRVRFSLDIVGRSNRLDIQEHFLMTEVTDRDGNSYGPIIEDIMVGANVGTDVNLSDQHTPAIIAPFNLIGSSTELTNPIAINDYQITVDNIGSADIIINNYVVLFHPGSERFSQFYITAIAGNVLTLDRLVDFAYPAGTYVDIGTTNMGGVVGSLAAPKIFGLRGTGAPPGVDITLDTTRIFFTARTDTSVDLAKFCDIPALTNGLFLRSRNGEHRNIFSIKSNGGLKAIAYDWDPYDAQNLNQGQHGMGSRLTFAGQSKIGVTIRLPIGEDLECLILDDLSDIAELFIVAEGHLVNPY